MDVCLIRRVSCSLSACYSPRHEGDARHDAEVALIKTAKLVIRSPEQPLVMHVDGGAAASPNGAHECTVELERGRLNVLVAR